MNIALVVKSSSNTLGGLNYEQGVIEEFSDTLGKIYSTHIVYTGSDKTKSSNRKQTHISYNNLDYLLMWLRNSIIGFRILSILRLKFGKLEKKLQHENIDIAYFLSPNELALDLVNTPFITTIWDLAHLEYPYFPEFFANGNFDKREYYYEKTTKKSFLIICESVTTKKNIENRYRIDGNKIIDLGFPIEYLINKSNKIDNKLFEVPKKPYIVYPASFWPHKNHFFLIKIVEKLKKQLPDILVILTGFDQGNLSYVLKKIRTKNLASNIIYLGNLTYDNTINLMKNSLGIIMPTKLGPTNLPPIEAAILGKFAILGDVHEEFLPPEVAAYISLEDLDLWAKKIYDLFKNPNEPRDILKTLRNMSYKNKISKISEKLSILSDDIKNWQEERNSTH